ncbi:MAG: DUF3378 domain-containing protein [Candidatus Diapherotrites archaeon]
MQSVLNFKPEEKKKVLEALKQFKPKNAGSEFEAHAVEIDGCRVTFFQSGKLLIQGANAEHVKEKILQLVETEDELVLGIDEVGRGENFGPFIVAGVLGWTSKLRELRDSKKTADIEGKKKIVDENAVGQSLVVVSAGEIDERRGKGENLNQIQAECVNQIIGFFRKNFAEKFKIIVDGSPIAGISGVEFLPKGDDLVPQCGAASIVAKHARDKSADREKRKSWKN